MQPARNALSTEEWQQIRDLFEQCRDLSAADRKLLLDEKLQASPWLRPEVESLLKSSDSALTRLEQPLLPDLLGHVRKNLVLAAGREASFKPTRLGKYLLLKKLGQGGMAEVFLAKTMGPGGFQKCLAIKRVAAGFIEDPGFRQLFEYEARLSSLLSHPNIVGTYDFFLHQGICILVMEYVAGKNLRELTFGAEDGVPRVPPKIALHIVTEACRALDYAHRRRDDRTGEPLQIVHRDISPKNIMVSYDGAVKILDFGIAKARDRAVFTQAGAIRGTINYLAPEQIGAGEADQRGDLFSLCLVLYELLAGRPLFPSTSMVATLRQIEECSLPADRVEELGTHARLKAILHRGLRKDPAERYPDARSLLDDLQSFLRDTHSMDLDQLLAELMQEGFRKDREEEASLRSLILQTKEIGVSDPQPIPEIAPLSIEGLDHVSIEAPARTRRPAPSQITAFPLESAPRSSALTWLPLVIFVAAATFAVGRLVQLQKRRSEIARKGAEITAPAFAPAPTPANAAVSPPSDSLTACSAVITSKPSGALLSLDGIEMGTTPFTAAVRCGTKFQIQLELPGYSSLRREIKVSGRQSVLLLPLSRP